MDEAPPLAQMDADLVLERSEKRITIRSANRALELARTKGRPEELARALIRLAQLHFRQGRYSQAQMLAEEVLRDAPADSMMRCDALRLLGNCAAELGVPDGAENYYHQAIDLARQLDDHYTLHKCLHSLATNIYWPRGQFDLALAAGKEALSQAQTLQLEAELWFPLADIAWVYWSTGQRELANQIADQMETVVSPGSLGEGFYCCLRAGLVEPGEDLLTIVLPLYDRARSIAEVTGDPGLNVEVRLGLCRCHRAAADLPAAWAWAEDAVAVSMRLNYRQFQGLALIERGRIQLEQGDPTAAETDLRAALEIAAQLRSNFDLARASLYLAALLFTQQRPEAKTAWEQAVRRVLDNGYDFLLEQERALILPFVAAYLDDPDPALAQVSQELADRLLHVSPAPLQVKALGQFSVRVGAHAIAKEALRQRRAGELLALLLASPGYSLSPLQVTEAMCPEKDPDAALDFYHHASSALRRLLEPDLPDRRFPCRYLDVDDETISLRLPAGSRIDFKLFELACQENDWTAAAEHYRGEFLPTLRYAEWAIPIRQHLADLYEATLLSLAESKLQAGDPKACHDLSYQVLRHNPWQERAVELGMRAATALGDRSTALKLYHRLEKVLAHELGIAPQKELQQLYVAVKKGRSR